MTRQQVLMLAGAVVLCATAGARGDVIGIFWEGSNTEWDVFAAVTADTVLLTADMGDVGLNEPPDGVNNGLYSSMGQIIPLGSFVTFGGVPPIPIRLLTITPSGTGSLADALSFVIAGVAAQPHPNDFSGYALQLGHFVVEPDTFIGGLGGPDLDVQSRIHLGWTDIDGPPESGVFNIPRNPGPLVVPLDIEPGDCPNEFKPRLGNSGHKIDIALVGTAEFNVSDVDFSTILLSRADGVGGAGLPERVRVKDRATPFDGEPCGCHERKKDGIPDLRMRFFAVEMTFEMELDLLAEGDFVELMVTGELLDGTPFVASDCIVIEDPPGRDDDDSDDESEDDSDDDSSDKSDDDSDS